MTWLHPRRCRSGRNRRAARVAASACRAPPAGSAAPARAAAHLVHHNGGGDDFAVQRQFAGRLQRFQADFTRRQQQLDEGAVAIGLLEDVRARLHGDRQLPFSERHAVAQRAWLSLQDRQVVPGIEIS